jgi:peptidoglycan hydrolase-like protein with peptidoglycan-binding domain
MDLKNQPIAKGDSRSDIIEALQSALMVLGYNVGVSGVTGNFDDGTESAVKNFQQDAKDWKGNPLNSDGRVEELTCDALNRSLVGSWFDSYQTPVGLTNGTVILTLTKETMRSSISLEYPSKN